VTVAAQPQEPTGQPLRPRAQLRLIVPFVLVTLIWSTTWIVIRDQLGIVPPSWSVTYRFASAAVAMWLWALATRQPLRLAPGGHPFALAFGIAMFVVNFNLVYRAEGYVTSGVVAVAFALIVVPNVLLGRIFLGQVATARFLLGSAIGVVGVALLFLHELEALAVPGGHAGLGIAMTLLAVFSASIGNVMQGSAAAKRQPLGATLAWGMLYGALANAVVAFILVGPPTIELRAGYLFGVAYLGVLGSMLAFQLYFALIREMGPARAGYINVLVPVIAMTLSSVFEGYRWTLLSVSGALLAILGLIVALKARSPAR
jgi:drug/metabolite transporter (DMT)-like permease